MPLLSLPIELILLIANKIDPESDMNAFNRTNKLFNTLTTNSLYKNNIQKHNSSALFWASKRAVTGQHLNTACFLLDHGADIHAPTVSVDGIDIHQTPLAGAALREAILAGCLEMVEFLLSRGADANAEFDVCQCMRLKSLENSNEAANSDMQALCVYSTPVEQAVE
ncbi:hypothetical protein BDW69DRAFT_182105 [Aspergillus filifer]